MSTNLNHPSEDKDRFYGLLENPRISLLQRLLLDGGRCFGLKYYLQKYDFKNVIDIGCGTGENSTIFNNRYTGIDDSIKRIEFAQRKYPKQKFINLDARYLEYPDNSFDAGLIIDTSHHLNDKNFIEILSKLKNICSEYIVVSDPILFDEQTKLSKIFYNLDRGKNFRSQKNLVNIFSTSAKVVSGYLFFIIGNILTIILLIDERSNNWFSEVLFDSIKVFISDSISEIISFNLPKFIYSMIILN